ncbi:kinase-like protein [Rickenella mellea]|uniref:Kinase-like protein n=1 Tax=Rickenella mellea TaxID=50990 RepID=A0A4Y7Q7G3_9AGAM|nr:kinase-like protein [Rickenella mellea]
MSPPVEDGQYEIVNTRWKTSALLNDNEELVADAQPRKNRRITNEMLWNVSILTNDHYTIQNVATESYASRPSRAEEGDPVGALSSPQRPTQWIIKETRFKGRFTITATDSAHQELFWSVADGEPGTPISLHSVPTNNRNQWEFREHNYVVEDKQSSEANATASGARHAVGRTELLFTFDADILGDNTLTRRLKFRNKVAQTLDDVLKINLRGHLWAFIRDHMKLYSVSVYYLLVFMRTHASLGIESSFTKRHTSFSEKVREWSAMDLVHTIVKHREIHVTISNTIAWARTTADGLVWSTVFNAAILNDRDDMSGSISALTETAERERVMALSSEELSVVMKYLQACIDERCPDHHKLESLLRSIVGARGSIPDFLFIKGVHRTSEQSFYVTGLANLWKGETQGKLVMLKVPRINLKQTVPALEKDIGKEAIIWRQLYHRNILPFYGCSADLFSPNYALVSPLMTSGNLMEYLRKHPTLDRLAMIRGVASGLRYLHELRPQVVHGDLKGLNVMIDGDGGPRIADFGLARVVDAYSVEDGVEQFSVRWAAPELFDWPHGFDANTTDKSDVYAFACLCLEIFTGNHPFEDLVQDGSVIIAVLKGDRPARPGEVATQRGLDNQVWQLIENCWMHEPLDRPDMAAVLSQLSELIHPGDSHLDDVETPRTDFVFNRVEIFKLPRDCLQKNIQQLRLLKN